MILTDLLRAMGLTELIMFLWLSILLDVPRYLLGAITVALVSPDNLPPQSLSVSAIVPCLNETKMLVRCLDSLGPEVDEIIVVDDASTDGTYELARALGMRVIRLNERVGKPAAINAALPMVKSDLVLLLDADTILEPGAVRRAAGHFDHPAIGGVSFNLMPCNADASLIARYQAIEYAVAISAGRRLSDALGILPNVSGAAGLFRRSALVAVGGLDIEVAEDAALSMKLRTAGWRLRFAPLATAMTRVPETLSGLTLQRLRWDASIITIWWHKYAAAINPFSRRCDPMTSLDVLIFSAILPLILPVYIFWAWLQVGAGVFVILAAAVLALAVIEAATLLLVPVSPRLLLYMPFYMATQLFVMRPLRVVAILGELIFSITRHDPYIPKSQRGRLS